MDCGHCTDLQHVKPSCPTHGDKGLGLAHAILDPEIVETMAFEEVERNPTGYEQDHLKAVMVRTRGHGNPKAVMEAIRRAVAALPSKMLAGHTRDCSMSGCTLIPECRIKELK